MKLPLVPSNRQWRNWSLPSKLTTIGALLAVISFLLAIGMALVEGLSSPGSRPELYLTISDEETITWSFAEDDESLRYPIETMIFEAISPEEFHDCIFSTQPRDSLEMKIAAKAFILNAGNKKAKDIWFRIYVDPEITVWVIGTDEWNTGADQEQGNTVLSFKGNKAFEVDKQSTKSALGIISLTVPPIPRSYQLKYAIGADDMPLRERFLNLQVKTSNVPFEFIENAKGLEMMSKRDLTAALGHFKNAVTASQDFGAFHFNAGTVLLMLNRLKEAEVYLLRAKELSPEAYEVWGNLGACYLAQGKLMDALPVIQKALEINPESELDKNNLLYTLKSLKSKEPN